MYLELVTKTELLLCAWSSVSGVIQVCWTHSYCKWSFLDPAWNIVIKKPQQNRTIPNSPKTHSWKWIYHLSPILWSPLLYFLSRVGFWMLWTAEIAFGKICHHLVSSIRSPIHSSQHHLHFLSNLLPHCLLICDTSILPNLPDSLQRWQKTWNLRLGLYLIQRKAGLSSAPCLLPFLPPFKSAS